jgi:Binding-prot-dependent transport system membrane comp, N-term
VTATNAQTIVFKLSQPDPNFPKQLAEPDSAIYPAAGLAQGTSFFNKPVSAGRYLLQSSDLGTGRFVFTATPRWRPGTPRRAASARRSGINVQALPVAAAAPPAWRPARVARLAIAIGKPLLHAAMVAVCVAVVTFFLIHLMLGDPARRLAGEAGQVASPQQIAALRAQLGLNRGLLAQFVSYLAGLAHGDFGTSFQYRGTAVSSIVFGTLGTTAILSAVTIAVSTAAGILLGLLLAGTRSRVVDNAGRIASMIALSAPRALVGLVLLLWVAVHGNFLPAGG